MRFDRKEIGSRGEELAVSFLRAQNYKIMTRNYRCRYGEIDIIAEDKGTLVFVEVKTRSSTEFGTGLEAVNYMKIRRIKKTALVYLAEKTVVYNGMRFDVIDIRMENQQNPKITHIKNAF